MGTNTSRILLRVLLGCCGAAKEKLGTRTSLKPLPSVSFQLSEDGEVEESVFDVDEKNKRNS